MRTYENGWKWRNYFHFNKLKNQPYDYQRNGLLRRLLPENYVNSKNTVFQAVLSVIEYPSIHILKMIDTLANFRNINYRNY